MRERRIGPTLSATFADLPQRRETHHKKPRYKGGGNEPENLTRVTLPEHALEHFRNATTAEDSDTASAEYWSVRKIVQRMLPEELSEFNNLIRKKK